MLLTYDTSEQGFTKNWAVLFVTAFTIMASGSFTTLAGLLTATLVTNFGWSTSEIGIGVSINMLLYGLTAPFAIQVMKKYGVRIVTTSALLLMIIGNLLILSQNVLVFNLSWGLLVGLGTGSLTMAYGAYVARNWFPIEKQGLVAGILTASAVVGQFALLPFWASILVLYGWYAPLLGSSLIALVAIVLNLIIFPKHGGELPTRAATGKPTSLFFEATRVLMAVIKSRAFWVLASIFMICGATTNGLLWSHFILACSDAGISSVKASSVLFLVGIFNVAGTVFSGWLTDRISPRLILASVFLARAATLLWLPLIIISDFDAKMLIFGILFGILDVATVPPVITLCNKVFGDNGPSVFAWINAFHQLGAGAMVLSGGIIRTTMGDYQFMWLTAAFLSVIAVAVSYSDRFDKPQVQTLN
ncbi:MAG: putative MFS family arabinose efflux permease [Motiliproteus sp.]|jgi:predicted MFS family arabinose efflux permease